MDKTIQKEKNREQVMILDEAIERYKDNAEYERTHGNLQGYLDFRQLTEWLTDYKRLKEQEPCEDTISREDALMCMTGEYIADMTCKPEDIISKHIQRLRSLPPVKPQEPFKPMVEIDLYSVIKQKYIERVVLDKIKAKIEEIETYDGLYIDRAYVLQIIDKYKEESEDKENE